MRCLSGLNSLEGLGLRWDHEGGGRRCGDVPGVKFGRGGGLGSLGWDHCGIGWGGLREARGLSVLLQGGHGGGARAVSTLDTVVHHGLSGGRARARAAGPGRGQGVGLHQLGLWSLCVLPDFIWSLFFLIFLFLLFPKDKPYD